MLKLRQFILTLLLCFLLNSKGSTGGIEMSIEDSFSSHASSAPLVDITPLRPYTIFAFTNSYHPSLHQQDLENVAVKGTPSYRYVSLKLKGKKFHAPVEFDEEPFTPMNTSPESTFNRRNLKGFLNFIENKDEQNRLTLTFCFNTAQIEIQTDGAIKLSFEKFTQTLATFIRSHQNRMQFFGDS